MRMAIVWCIRSW